MPIGDIPDFDHLIFGNALTRLSGSKVRLEPDPERDDNHPISRSESCFYFFPDVLVLIFYGSRRFGSIP